VALLRQVHEHDRYPLAWPADPAAWLSGRRQLDAWVARQGPAACGHVALARPGSGPAAEIWARHLRAPGSEVLCVAQLFTAPHARGSGTGGRLLATALVRARARGAAAVLEVITLNQDAIALYRVRGWRQVGSVSYDWLPPGERSLLFVAPEPQAAACPGPG